MNLKALRMAVDDLVRFYPEEFPDRDAILKKIDEFERALPAIQADVAKGMGQFVGLSYNRRHQLFPGIHLTLGR